MELLVLQGVDRGCSSRGLVVAGLVAAAAVLGSCQATTSQIPLTTGTRARSVATDIRTSSGFSRTGSDHPDRHIHEPTRAGLSPGCLREHDLGEPDGERLYVSGGTGTSWVVVPVNLRTRTVLPAIQVGLEPGAFAPTRTEESSTSLTAAARPLAPKVVISPRSLRPPTRRAQPSCPTRLPNRW